MSGPSPMSLPWRLREPDPDAVRRVARRHDLPELVARLLVSRGHDTPERAEAHLSASAMDLHDPFLLPDMEEGAERVARAIREGETVLVHGDYDVDGVTGTTLLVRLIRLLGGKVVWHIPNRLVDGYSFGAHSVERAREVGAGVVISVDNGTSAHDVIAELRANGVDTVVTDHHEPPDGPLPPAVALVNPKLRDSRYPWRELCGGAVAFKLAWGVAQKITGSQRVSPELKRFLEEATAYVAIATVCDVVPLADENRVFARFGLKALAQATSPGLRALVASAGLAGRPLSAEDVSFQIGPRLNASGRLGSARTAVELLLAEDADEARRLAGELDALNRERREIEALVTQEARAAAAGHETDEVLVLAGQGWHQGVVGIVAARLVEELGRPAIVIGLDGAEGRGSARSLPGFDVLRAMRAGAPHLERFGGHEQAAGLEIRAENVDAAREAICAEARRMLAEGPPPGAEVWIDHEVPFHHVTPSTMKQIDRLEPFGQGNAKPVLLSRGLRLACPPQRVGETGAHLRLSLRRADHVLKAMAFRMGHRASELELGVPVDAVFTPRWNHFRGETNLELQLVDFRTGDA